MCVRSFVTDELNRFEAESQKPLPFAQAGHVDESDTGPSPTEWRRCGPRSPLARRLQRSLLIRRKSAGSARYTGTDAHEYDITVSHNIGRQFQPTHGGFIKKGRQWRGQIRRTGSLQQTDQRFTHVDWHGRKCRLSAGERR